MELLVQNWSLSAKLRLPAISRLQKVHNVDIALQVLKDKGIDLKDERGNTFLFWLFTHQETKMQTISVSNYLLLCTKSILSLCLFLGNTIESRDIVDGHREKTLSLLWKILFAFHVCIFSCFMLNYTIMALWLTKQNLKHILFLGT